MNIFNIIIYCFAGILLISMLAGSIAALFKKLFGRKSSNTDESDTHYEEQRRECQPSRSSHERNDAPATPPHHNSHSEEDDEDISREDRELANLNEMTGVLEAMGCQPRPTEENNLAVAYQGENFLIQPNGGYLRIWDLNWLSSKTTDDDFLLLKDAANYANFSFGPTIVMHAPDEDGNIYVSSRMDIFMMPGLEENQAYVESILNSFFSIKHITHREYMRLKEDPRDRTLDTNPIGFDTASLADPSSPQAN